jgi:hypothetical protein
MKKYIQNNKNIFFIQIAYYTHMGQAITIQLTKACKHIKEKQLTSCYDLSVYIVNSVHICISLYLYVLWFKRNKESKSNLGR